MQQLNEKFGSKRAAAAIRLVLAPYYAVVVNMLTNNMTGSFGD